MTIGQATAVELLYAAVIGDTGDLGNLVRELLLLHTPTFDGTGAPAPGCVTCRGTGQPAGFDDADHCHCQCGCCACGQPVCGGPCDHVAAMLGVLVLRGGVPADAVDVPRLLARFHADGARRVVAGITAGRSRAVATVEPDDSGARVTLRDRTAVAEVEQALQAAGYTCTRSDLPGPHTALTLTALYKG